MAHDQTLGGERVRLHVDVGSCDSVDEGGLADVREAGDQDRPRGARSGAAARS